MGYFLEDQDMKLSPKKAMNQDVEHRSRVSSAQSESHQTFKEKLLWQKKQEI